MKKYIYCDACDVGNNITALNEIMRKNNVYWNIIVKEYHGKKYPVGTRVIIVG